MLNIWFCLLQGIANLSDNDDDDSNEDVEKISTMNGTYVILHIWLEWKGAIKVQNHKIHV